MEWGAKENGTGGNTQTNPQRTTTSGVERQGGGGTTTALKEGEGGEGGEPGYTPTPEDLCLREVYGDWVNANPGTHLDSGIGDDTTWQVWWRDLAVMPSRRYDAPSGKFGKRFVVTLGGDLRGMRDIQWDSERFIVFQMVILKRA